MADEKEKKEVKKGLPFIAKILIIAIVLILIVVISVGSAFFIASKVNKSSGDGSNVVEHAKVDEKSGESEEGYGVTVEFGEYTVNLNEVEPKYLVIKINFELNPELKEKKVVEVETSIEEKKVILQDVMLSILRNKSMADLTADTDYVKLKEELTKEVNKVLGEDSVKTIRFNNLLIQ